MGNIFNFHGNVNMNVYCKKCTITEEPDSGCGLEINSITVDFEIGFIFELTNTSGTYVGAIITTNDSPVDLGCQETTSQYIISLENAQALFSGQTIVFTSYSDNCQTSTCEVIIPISFNQLEIPVTGENTTFELNGEPICTEDSSYSIVLAGPSSIVMNNTNGNLTIPAQEIEGNGPGGVYIYYYICGGEVVYFVIVFMANPQGPQQMYSCDGATCIEDNNGQYDHLSCYGNCNGGSGGTMYSCAEATCVEDENGIYNNSNCDWACESPQLLGFIELNDIGNSPVPGNSAEDWTTWMNGGATQWEANFTSTVVIGNKIEFYGVPQLNERIFLVGLTLTDYDLLNFSYLKEIDFYGLVGMFAFTPSIYLQLVNVVIASCDIVDFNFNNSPNLEKLNIQNADASSLNISSCSQLNTFYTTGSILPALDFSNNLLLTSIVFRSCTGVPTVDITLNTLLTWFEGSGDFITLDVSNNVNLTFLGVSAPNLPSLNIDTLTLLETINIEGCALVTALDTSNQPNLITARIGQSGLLAFDPSSNPLLVMLWVNDTLITTIDVSSNTLLTGFSVDNCPIATMTLVASITQLGAYNFPLTSLDISVATNLENINVANGSLTNLDITDSVAWTQLALNGNDISSDVDINAILAHLVSITYAGYLNISGGTNAAPTGQGILDVATLIGNGASVFTN